MKYRTDLEIAILKMRTVYNTIQFVLLMLLLFNCTYLNTKEKWIKIEGEIYNLVIQQDNFAFHFTDKQGQIVAPSNAQSGLVFSGSQVVSVEKADAESKEDKVNIFLVTNEAGNKARVEVVFEDGIAKFQIYPQIDRRSKVSLSLGGMPVAHGLGDAGAYEESFNLANNGLEEYPIENNGGRKRWVSTFAIFPQNNVAGVFFGDGKKSVAINEREYTMSISTKGAASFYYILGTPKQIYKKYKEVRNLEVYVDIKPKFRLFELGWESWDALGWNTNQETVKQILEKFQNEGYPIRWAVTGSGFWEKGGTTTSFGKWGEKFPNPHRFKKWMHEHDIKWMIGLRTNFVPQGGPYIPISDKRDRNLKGNVYDGNVLSDEGLNNNYFLKDAYGELVTVTSQWFPQVPCYLLDGNMPGAARWYQQNYMNWDVDGIKEDTMMDIDSATSIYNAPVVEIAMNEGLVMARNGEISSPGTLLRINDTNVRDLSQRTPVNYFQYAASGFANVYSDVAGIHNMHNIEDIDRNIRHAWLLSLTSGMSVGAYPDNWPLEKQEMFKKASNFHYTIAPYLYSAAIDGYTSGFPHTLTPLTIAYPDDSSVMLLDNFEWKVGESILATPILNASKTRMDIYLPLGIWYDYESGEKFQGPAVLKDFEMKLDKIPCFVGGKGIIVERIGETLLAKIYPVLDSARMTFTHPTRDMQSIIEIKGVDFTEVQVTDLTENKLVSFDKEGHAISFELEGGHDYKVE